MQRRREFRHGLFSSHDLIWVFVVHCCSAHMCLLVCEQTFYIALKILIRGKQCMGFEATVEGMISPSPGLTLNAYLFTMLWVVEP